jgi:hypothetical protein
MKWVNGIEKGRTTKTKKKKNVGDDGGNGKETKKTTTTHVSNKKESKKPKNLENAKSIAKQSFLFPKEMFPPNPKILPSTKLIPFKSTH